jgi:hypothetical protein
MAAWFDEVRHAGLPRGDSIDVDFHSVPANTAVEPLEKHYISSRSRSQQGVLVFLARDAQARVMCYAHAGIPKEQKAAEVLRFADFWKERTGSVPAELVFDSQLTTYQHLHQLNRRGIRFLTLRRRTHQMLGRIWSLPTSAWRRITLPSLTRAFRTPKVLDERIELPGYLLAWPRLNAAAFRGRIASRFGGSPFRKSFQRCLRLLRLACCCRAAGNTFEDLSGINRTNVLKDLDCAKAADHFRCAHLRWLVEQLLDPPLNLHGRVALQSIA